MSFKLFVSSCFIVAMITKPNNIVGYWSLNYPKCIHDGQPNYNVIMRDNLIIQNT